MDPSGPDPARALSNRQQIGLASLWLAMFAQWMTVVPIIVPHQVAAIIGEHHPQREGIVGTIVGAGALVALVVAPLAGALSDAHRGPRGRRRPFLITGSLATCASLMLLVPLGSHSGLWTYALVFLNLQFWWNWVAGAYAGLVPDVVSAGQRAAASNWLNITTILGTITGNLILALCYQPGQPGPSLAIFAALTVICLLTTLGAVREPPTDASRRRFDTGEFLRGIFVDPRAHPAFYWVLITRFMANMGVWSIFTFLVFYLSEVVGVAQPAQLLTMLLAAGAVLSVPASIAGITASRRHGLVAVVRMTSWVMALAALSYVLIALHPALWLVVPVVLVFAAGYGAYQAVDWALALEVLPDLEHAGKDMGVWHISMVLPQILGPLISGWMISALSMTVSPRAAYIAAFGLAAAWFVAAAWLVGRVRLTRDEGR